MYLFATGQMKSNKKEELIRILDRFNIQVDNPVSLLNQETSRNFLHSTNPSTLYQVELLLMLYHYYWYSSLSNPRFLSQVRWPVASVPGFLKSLLCMQICICVRP